MNDVELAVRRDRFPGALKTTNFAKLIERHPEDVILYKLIYYREGASERHLRDVAGILRVSGSDVDLAYIDEWARRLDLADVWNAIRRRLGER